VSEKAFFRTGYMKNEKIRLLEPIYGDHGLALDLNWVVRCRLMIAYCRVEDVAYDARG
jgi:hypothetical protein